MPADEIVHLVAEGPDWTAIAGIVGAGLFGLLGGWAADKRRSHEDRERDTRHFSHNRALHSADDLVSRIDDVEVALDKLGAACAEMRQRVLSLGPDVDEVGPKQRSAEDAYQHARAVIARLGTRPHAGPQLIEHGTWSLGLPA